MIGCQLIWLIAVIDWLRLSPCGDAYILFFGSIIEMKWISPSELRVIWYLSPGVCILGTFWLIDVIKYWFLLGGWHVKRLRVQMGIKCANCIYWVYARNTLYGTCCGVVPVVLNKMCKWGRDCVEFKFIDFAEAEKNSNFATRISLSQADTFWLLGLGVENYNQRGPVLRLECVQL